MREDPVQLGQQGARPRGALRHRDAQHPLGGQDDAQLVAECRKPVVPVGQHDDLPVVADLEQLLGAAVHVADDRLGRDDALAVEHQPQPQHAVRRGMLRADVEDHLLGRKTVVHAQLTGAGADAGGAFGEACHGGLDSRPGLCRRGGRRVQSAITPGASAGPGRWAHRPVVEAPCQVSRRPVRCASGRRRAPDTVGLLGRVGGVEQPRHPAGAGPRHRPRTRAGHPSILRGRRRPAAPAR